MNKKGKEQGTNLIIKILLLVAVLFTLFSGINGIVIGMGRESLIRVIASNHITPMKIIYIVMGIGSLVTGVFLAIKLLKE